MHAESGRRGRGGRLLRPGRRQRTHASEQGFTRNFDEMLVQDVVKPYMPPRNERAAAAYAACTDYLLEPEAVGQETEQYVYYLVDRLHKNPPGMTELKLHHLALGDQQAKTLAGGLMGNHTVHALSLSHNSLVGGRASNATLLSDCLLLEG